MTKTIGFDYETFYDTKNGLGIKEQGMDAYCRDPRFNAYLLSVSDGEQSWAGQPKNFNWDALEGQIVLSHNKAFDSRVYKEMVKRGLAPKINIKEWHCTANLTTYLCMRRDLMRASEFLLGVTLEKEVRGAADGKGWEELTKEDGGKSMLEYARKDAYYCWLLWHKFGHLWPQFERDLSNLTIKQGARGIQIDVDKLNRYIAVTQETLVRTELNLPWMKEGKKPTSTKAIAEECRKNSIPCPPVKSRDGEEAFDQWAATYGPKFPWVAAFSNYRLVNKLLTTLETIKSRLFNEDADSGIFPFDLLYFGAHTGRWAGSGGFNMQNMRKTPYYIGLDGLLITDAAMLKFIDEEIFKTGKPPSIVSFVIDIRSLFVARPGKKLIISDLSQIEPRVLSWLIGDTRKLDLMAQGKSPYQAHAELTMGWTGGDLKKANKELYALAKARELGLGYQCGWKKFIVMAMTLAGLDITKDDPEFVPALSPEGNPCFDSEGKPIMVSGYGYNSKKVVEEYRAQNPLIASQDEENPGIWAKLDRAFKGSVGGDFEITLPNGRKLRYPDVRWERKAIEDPDHPGKFKFQRAVTAFAFDQKRNCVVRKAFYGGSLTENATQAVARDIFGEHLLTLDRTSGIDVLFHVHDEAVNEVEPDITKRDIEHIMSKPPEWMPGLPVAAEAVEAPHYLK